MFHRDGMSICISNFMGHSLNVKYNGNGKLTFLRTPLMLFPVYISIHPHGCSHFLLQPGWNFQQTFKGIFPL